MTPGQAVRPVLLECKVFRARPVPPVAPGLSARREGSALRAPPDPTAAPETKDRLVPREERGLRVFLDLQVLRVVEVWDPSVPQEQQVPLEVLVPQVPPVQTDGLV